MMDEGVFCFVRETPPYSSIHMIPKSYFKGRGLDFISATQLGNGCYGTIYDNIGKPDLVLKIVSLTREQTLDYEDPVENYNDFKTDRTQRFNDESTIGRIMSENSLGPRIVDTWICHDNVLLTYFNGTSVCVLSDVVGCIVMEKIRGVDLMKYIETYTDCFLANYDRIWGLLKQSLAHVASLGYFGTDIVLENIMVKFTQPKVIEKLVLIDFDGYKTNQGTHLEAFDKMEYVFSELSHEFKKRNGRVS